MTYKSLHNSIKNDKLVFFYTLHSLSLLYTAAANPFLSIKFSEYYFKIFFTMLSFFSICLIFLLFKSKENKILFNADLFLFKI